MYIERCACMCVNGTNICNILYEDEKVSRVWPFSRLTRCRRSNQSDDPPRDGPLVSPGTSPTPVRRFANGPDRVSDTPLRVIVYHEYSWIRPPAVGPWPGSHNRHPVQCGNCASVSSDLTDSPASVLQHDRETVIYHNNVVHAYNTLYGNRIRASCRRRCRRQLRGKCKPNMMRINDSSIKTVMLMIDDHKIWLQLLTGIDLDAFIHIF